MLEVKSLTKRFRGPNGSGKSTTVKIITGLLEPSDGEVRLHGRALVDDPIAFKSRLGYVPEKPYLYTHLSGAEYLIFIARLR